MKKVLVLAAHPDDETLGCGGTINRLSKEGCQIQLITFTNGESSRGESNKDRNNLLDKVSDKLGIQKFSSGDFPDNAMDSIPLINICKFIEAEVTYNPDIIFTHHPEDMNIDHQLVAKATFTVFRPQSGGKHQIFSFFVPSSTDYNPTLNLVGHSYFKLLKENLEAKLETLKIYDNEMRNYPHTRSYKNIENLMRVWGSEVGTEFAEKFLKIRELV